MALGEIEVEVLWSCGDDYEAPHTIARQVGMRMEREVSEAEVRATLVALAWQGLLQAYVFEDDAQRWRAISPEAAERGDDPWFRVTVQGQIALEDEEGD